MSAEDIPQSVVEAVADVLRPSRELTGNVSAEAVARSDARVSLTAALLEYERLGWFLVPPATELVPRTAPTFDELFPEGL